MNAKNAILETPYGTRDLLPADVIEMRYLDQILSQIFSSWGYDEIATPTIEHLETLVSRIQEENDLFILSGNKNRLLALRNEMTTNHARAQGNEGVKKKRRRRPRKKKTEQGQ